PHKELEALIRRYLGPRRRAGQGFRSDPPDRYEDALARTRFGTPRVVFAPGRPDVGRGGGAGEGFRSDPPDRYEDALARTRFGTPRVVFAPGRPDVVRDVDSVLA